MHICDEKTGRLLILGMGNPILGDDAAGLHALAKAQDALPDHTSVTFKPADSSGLDLISEIEGFDAMIVVDACCRPGTVPGNVNCMKAKEIDHCSQNIHSSHYAHLPSTLELGRWLGYRTPDLLGVVAIEVPENSMEFGFQLSPEVADAIPQASKMICSMAERFLETSTLD